MLGEAGFRAQVEPDGAFAICDWGEGNSTLGIVPHLDIVSADSGWTSNPFHPVRNGDFLVGRGVSDNKGGAVMAIWAMRALRETGFVPRGRVRLCMGGNEETGMEDMKLFRERYGAPSFSLVPDAFFAVGIGQKGRAMLRLKLKDHLKDIRDIEGGNITSGSVPAQAACTLPDNQAVRHALETIDREAERLSWCETDCGIRLAAEGVSAHTAMPQGSVNALWILVRTLGTLKCIDEGDRRAMAELAELTAGYNGAGMGIDTEDEVSGALTCVAFYLGRSGEKIHVDCNIRFPVSVDEKELEAAIRSRLAGCLCWELDEFHSNSPYYLPADREEVSLLRRAYEACTGEAADLYVHPGGTYAKELGNAVIFGNEFRKSIPFPEGRGRAHQADEAVSITDLIEGTSVYCEAIWMLDRFLVEKGEKT